LEESSCCLLVYVSKSKSNELASIDHNRRFPVGDKQTHPISSDTSYYGQFLSKDIVDQMKACNGENLKRRQKKENEREARE